MASTHDPTAPGVSASASSNGGRLGPDAVTDDQAPPEALKDLGTRFAELGEYVSYYITAKLDGIKVSLRNVGIMAGLGVVGLIAAGGFVVTVIVLLLRGIAHGIGDLLWDKWWLGELITGVLFLTALGVGVMIAMKKLTKSSRERTATKYAARQQTERSKFGTDVHQRAQDPAE
ncbi:MAG: hypothetical protein QOF78_4625 [Phycisphaerales bacterium]|jgi:hypothetical protein|nr:hypothetical protein [Phycisphaerales bacterium]